jgi:hypothetical protein
MLGTSNQITATPDVGTVVIALASDAHLPGTGSVGLPSGTTAQRSGLAGAIRFNSQASVFESTVDGVTWATIETSAIGVISIIGTANQILVSSPTGSVTISLVSNAVLPGAAGVTLPSGNTAARGSVAGSIRFNSQTNVVELTNDGSNWYSVLSNGSTVVLTISGTTNRITVTGTSNAVIDIAATYVGQSSITTLGTITTGVWNGTVVDVTHGGTGVATMTTAYAPVCAGTTATGSLQVASTGLSTSGFVLTSNGSSSIPSFQASPTGGLTTVTVNIPLANFNNSASVPVTLIAAPGAGKEIIATSLILKIVIAGVVFVGSTATTSSGNAMCGMITGNIVSNAPTTYYFISVPTITPATNGQAALNDAFKLASSGNYTGGTGSTIDATITYYVVTVP